MITRLKRAIRETRGALGPRGAILAYHRIAPVEDDCYGLCVTPEHFEQHLRVIRDRFNPMSLSDLGDSLHSGRLPDRSVCVTFDDGYSDNLLVAKPLLEAYGVPATVFVTSGRSGRDREFWWDELQGLFLSSGDLPETLELEINGERRTWNLGQSQADSGAPPWCLLDPEDLTNAPTARHRVLGEIYSLIRPMRDREQWAVLDQLQSWSGGRPMVRPVVRAMELEETVTLSSGGLIEVGGHTINHPFLGLLSEEEQRQEILEGKQDLERALGRRVRAFAFPFGHYNETTLGILEASEFEYACTCIPQEVRLDSPALLLPRRGVGDWDGDRLALELEYLVRPARTRLLERLHLA